MFLPRKILEEKMLQLLREDLGQGDVTSSLVVPSETEAEAVVIAKEKGTVAGIEEADVLLRVLGLSTEIKAKDGEKVDPKQVLLKVVGNARTLLSSERTLLNLLSRMSGIATATRNLVERLRKAGIQTRVACTRKTAPGLMYFDKKAVSIGGGDTHRLHLDDMVLLKDNHIFLSGGVVKAVEEARKQVSLSKKIEVEVTRVHDVPSAVMAGADIVMLDNFSPKQITEAIALLKKEKLRSKTLLEASGGIISENIMEYASTGVDLISLGEITHSCRSLNLSLELRSKRSE